MLPEALATLPPFASITFNSEESSGENCKPEVAKTGLGSSAAMTTAVVAALLHYLGVVNLALLSDQNQVKDTTDLDVVHMIAQTAHCIAQGKVGSGFDVSSAVYGSHRYVRFSPEVISSAQVSFYLHKDVFPNTIYTCRMSYLLNDIVFKLFVIPLQDSAKGAPLQEVLLEILKGKWDHERTKFCLPPLMTLVRILLIFAIYLYLMCLCFIILDYQFIHDILLFSPLQISFISLNNRILLAKDCLLYFGSYDFCLLHRF